MKRFLQFLLFTIVVCAADTPAPFANIREIEDGLTAITGLRFTRDVPYAMIGKNQLRRYLEQRTKEATRPSEVRGEELTLKMLGLAPPDFDLRQNTIDLMTEQAAAFYDYNKKKLFILEGTGGDSEGRIALVHELAHALADQHFRLGRYIHEGAVSDDGATARMAVMEGQASWLMTAYMSKQTGGPAEAPESMLELMSRSIETSATQYPVYSQAPRYIRESLVFPYTGGMLFQNAIFRKLGRESFSEVFLHAPTSTQQILHPERYLAHDTPRIPLLPPVPDARKFRRLAEGTLGEFDFRVLLTQYAGKDEGVEAAMHLAGGSYKLLEHKHDKYPVLAFASTWDSPDAARKYFDLYRKVLQGKWKKLEIQSDTASSLAGRGDWGYFRMWIDGSTVNHIEGLTTPAGHPPMASPDGIPRW